MTVASAGWIKLTCGLDASCSRRFQTPDPIQGLLCYQCRRARFLKSRFFSTSREGIVKARTAPSEQNRHSSPIIMWNVISMNKKSQHTLFNKYFLFVFLSNNSTYITLSLCKPQTYLIFSGVFGKVLTKSMCDFQRTQQRLFDPNRATLGLQYINI